MEEANKTIETSTVTDWYSEITQYYESGCTRKEFLRDKPYTYKSFEYHLYKDPRHRKQPAKPAVEKKINFIPVVTKKPEEITVNGYTVGIDENTDENVLAKLLAAMRLVQ